MVDERLDIIEEKERQIVAEEKKIEAAEERITQEEKRILSSEQAILRSTRPGIKSLFRGKLTPPERYFVKQRIIKRFAKHKFLFSLLFTIGVVLVWRGIWHTADVTPLLSISVVSLGVGLFILWAIDRYTDLK